MAEETRSQYIARVMDPRTYGLPVGQITTVESINDGLLKLKAAGVNVLGPLSRIDFLPARHALVLRWAFLDQRVKGEWYKTPGGGGLSMHAVALDKLAQLSGMTWPAELTYRTDDGRTPLYWRVTVGAQLKLMGSTEPITKSIPGESDLRDGSAEAEKVLNEAKDPASGRGNLMRMRAKGSQRCVSITMAGLIRKMLCIRGSYSETEADMPFVWPSTVYVPPVGDAELDRLVALREMGLIESIYGGSRGRRDAIDTTFRPVEPLLIGEDGPVPDFTAERQRLDARERVPVSGAPPVGRDAGRGGYEPPPPDEDDAPPWTRGEPAAPPAPTGWNGTAYKMADVIDYVAAKWNGDLLKLDAAAQTKIADRLKTPAGRADIDTFLAAGARR